MNSTFNTPLNETKFYVIIKLLFSILANVGEIIMKESLQFYSTYLQKEKISLVQKLLKQVYKEIHISATSKDSLQVDMTKHQGLLENLLHRISLALLKTPKEQEAMHLKYDIHEYFLQEGTLLKDTVEILSEFRLQLMMNLKAQGIKQNIPNEDTLIVYEKIVFIFDETIRNTTTHFNLKHQEKVEAVENEILELGAPIVPLTKGIAILPLIGRFNQVRADYILSYVLPKVAEAHIDTLILDLSGVHVFDTFVAQSFFQIRDVLSLLGIEAIMTGIRPDLAQTAVQLGIPSTGLRMYNNVQHALESLNVL